jgi:AraC-like DNA-binding protein
MSHDTVEEIDQQLTRINDQLRRQSLPENAKPSIERATHYIHDHLYDQRLNVDYVISQCDIPSGTFSQRFAYHHGHSPHEYIQRQRIEVAKRLIEHGTENLFRIAMSVGYARYRTFARNFKNVTGCCPSEYPCNP